MTPGAPLRVARGGRRLWPALGTVTVERPEVTVNRRPVQGTVALNDGDKVATNARGRAHIDLPGRGAVDLLENTDPYFIREGACILVRLLFGTGRIWGVDVCVEDEGRNRIIMNSAVSVETDRQQTAFTVLNGTVRLRAARDGTEVTLAQGERIVIANTGVMNRILVPPTQLDATSRGRFRGRCPTATTSTWAPR